jgi:hypothetical protein
MANLLEEARDLIEMSLNPESDKESYAQRASQWLEKTAAARQAHEESPHDEVCGFDLTCPNCGD